MNGGKLSEDLLTMTQPSEASTKKRINHPLRWRTRRHGEKK